MIPAITPPTDNLYKFLSLFGLTIFLFAIYNLGFVYDNSSLSKMKIEDVKVEVQKKIYTNSQVLNDDLRISTDNSRFRPSKINRLGQDLQKLQKIVAQTPFKTLEKIELEGKISKLKVEVDALNLKFWSYAVMMSFGLVVMAIGFRRWKNKEQNIRDNILFLEHRLKEREENESYKRFLRQAIEKNN